MSARGRARMIREDLADRGIDDPRVLAAMGEIPREDFVPAALAADAYADQPLPIGDGQTISQPYIVALMTQAARLGPGDRVLEVGTGSGYQTAVLARLAAQVVSIERLARHADQAARRLRALGCTNVILRTGDGALGAPDRGPFDAILVTAAAPAPPAPLERQLAEGGRLVIPLGDRDQQRLVVLTRRGAHLVDRDLGPVRFVPLVSPEAFPTP